MANFDELDVPQHSEQDTSTPILTRREAAKIAATGIAGLAVGAVLPRQWIDPVVQVAFLPAHAEGSTLTPVQRARGRKISVRTLADAQAEPVPTQTNPAAPTEVPDVPDDVVPPDEPEGNPEGTGGGATGSNTQPETDNPDGTGAPPCPPSSIATPSDVRSTCTHNSATVTWNGNGERSFVVELREVGSSALPTLVEGLGTLRSFSGLRPCTNYSMTIRARTCGQLGPAHSAGFRTLMDPTIFPMVSVPSENVYCDGMYVTWTAVACAVGYEVQISESPSGPWKTTTSSSYTDVFFSDLCPNTTYYVRVRAIAPGGAKGQFSPIVSRTTGTTSSDGPCTPCLNYDYPYYTPPNENTTI